MIGNLLKALPGALVRYLRYQSTRLLRIGRADDMGVGEQPTGPVAPTMAAGSADVLYPRVGLNPAFLRNYPWPRYRQDAPPAALTDDPLFQLWAATKGGQKWSHYFGIYQEIFRPLKSRAMRILEIGVYKGASLDLWKAYFPHAETIIVGIDIHPSCAAYDAPKQGKHVRIGSQTDAKFLAAVAQEFGPFDLIIDDGSHFSADVIVSFNCLFLSGLKDSGIYVVEDLHAGYWNAWRNSSNTFFDLCRELVDHMHAHYKVAGPDAFFVERPSDHPTTSLDVPLITTMIREIRFFDSIIAIYRTRNEHVPFAVRMDLERGTDFVGTERK